MEKEDSIYMQGGYPQIKMEINIPNAKMVKIVPKATVDSSKKLSGMVINFLVKLLNS